MRRGVELIPDFYFPNKIDMFINKYNLDLGYN